MDQVPIKRALISVSNKSGVVKLAKALGKRGVEIISTGGTAKSIRDAGVKVTDISEYTGFPEMLDGRVKTLHPKVHGGLLARRDVADHQLTAKEHGIGMIDLVVVNLYPFEATVNKPGCTLEEAIENIDIGGPSMVRSAAKNHDAVAVVTDPEDYGAILEEMDEHDGALSLKTRKRLALKAFRTTSWYDHAIAEHLASQEDYGGTLFSPARLLALHPAQELRYGENPHQQAMFHRVGRHPAALGALQQISGKELSYNNLLDLDAALRCSGEFTDEPFAVIVKHTNPCGAAVGGSTAEAFARAHACDPLSAFGGIVGLNRPFDKATAAQLLEGDKFIEAIVAPDFDPDAVEAVVGKSEKKWRKSIRLVKASPLGQGAEYLEYRSVTGGMLVQTADTRRVDPAQIKVVTKTAPDNRAMDELFYAWIFCKHYKSNAIVVANHKSLLGYGAGQTNRVDAAAQALNRAGAKARGAYLASDAFFPFPDSVELAAMAGIAAIIQPGGSVNDKDVIAACDRHNVAMVFTGLRHFRH